MRNKFFFKFDTHFKYLYIVKFATIPVKFDTWSFPLNCIKLVTIRVKYFDARPSLSANNGND